MLVDIRFSYKHFKFWYVFPARQPFYLSYIQSINGPSAIHQYMMWMFIFFFKINLFQSKDYMTTQNHRNYVMQTNFPLDMHCYLSSWFVFLFGYKKNMYKLLNTTVVTKIIKIVSFWTVCWFWKLPKLRILTANGRLCTCLAVIDY